MWTGGSVLWSTAILAPAHLERMAGAHSLEKKAVSWVIFHKENKLYVEKYKE